MNDDDEEPYSIMIELKKLVSHEGIPADSPKFEHRLNQMKVVRCREMRGQPTCIECEAFDYCELAKKVMRANAGLDS